MTGVDTSSLPDRNSSSAGLHNLVTGLTAQSPAPSIIEHPSPLDRRINQFDDFPTSSSVAPAANLDSTPLSTSSDGRPSTGSARLQSTFQSSVSPSGPSNARQRRQDRVHPNSGRMTDDVTAGKEVDDPSRPQDLGTPETQSADLTPMALNRRLAWSSVISCSRQPSSDKTSNNLGGSLLRARVDAAAPLPHHLWTRGFLDGRHSDITVHAFGNAYTLHRILLDRSPFFSSALSEPWFESTAKEITLHPEEVDPNITQSAFQLALKRLYGSEVISEEETDPVGLFACGSWLEMTDLIQSSLQNLLSRMTTADIAARINLVTGSYYGQHGLCLLSAAKALLYREGWEMPLRHWDGIPAEIVQDVVGSDGFFVPGEWERWRLAKRLLERRLQQYGHASGMSVAQGKGKGKALTASKSGPVEVVAINKVDQLHAIYAHPEVAPLVELLDENIHYVHMTFEQLQHVRQERDTFGVPPVSEEALTNALWMAMELRSRVINAAGTNSELGLRLQARRPRRSFNKRVAGGEEIRKSPSDDSGGSSGENHVTSGTHSTNDKMGRPQPCRPRKYWIPQVDSTKVVGDTPDLSSRQFIPPSLRTSPPTHDLPSARLPIHTTRRSRDSVRAPANTNPLSASEGVDTYTPVYYTKYPPFRFSVEFPDPRLLKDKKRVYSHTVEYLGSHWNIYIQKIRSTKNVQLGVYLHRAKDREGEKKITHPSGPRSVDEAIGQLEREMLLRRRERRLRRQQQYEAQLEADEESSSGGDYHIASGETIGSARESHRRGPRAPIKRASHLPLVGGTTHESIGNPGQSSEDDEEAGPSGEDNVRDDTAAVMSASAVPILPAIPQYVDARPTIKTYFKIYSPGKRGLSVYESAPDEFNFSQSWGWRSSMIVDDEGAGSGEAASGGIEGRGRDGRLRYSVVLGDV